MLLCVNVTEEKAIPAGNSSSLKGEKSNIVQTHEKMQHEFSMQTNSKVDSNNNMVNESKSEPVAGNIKAKVKTEHMNTVIGDYDVTLGSNKSTEQLSSGFQKPGSVKQDEKHKDTNNVHLGVRYSKAQTGAFDQIKDRISQKDLDMHLIQNHIIKSDTKYNIGKDSDMVNKNPLHSNTASTNKSVHISKSNTENTPFEKQMDTSFNHSSNHSSTVNTPKDTEPSVQRDIHFNETKIHFLSEGPEANKTATNDTHTTLWMTIEPTVTTTSRNVTNTEISTKPPLEKRKSSLKGTVSNTHKVCQYHPIKLIKMCMYQYEINQLTLF